MEAVIDMIKITLFLFFLAVASCDKTTESIAGRVQITPLCGNVPTNINTEIHPCGFSKKELDEIYGAYQVVLKSASLELLAEKVLDGSGIFSFSVKEGEYIIDVTSKKPYGSPPKGVAQKVAVQKNQKIDIEIVVHTGIR
ncbi:MAG: hypothetical protein R2822_24750 [Spirosomataceae bacterium]